MSRFERQHSDPRAAAMAAICSALAGQSFVADRLRHLQRVMELDGRDAGLARQIAMGALRHVLTLDCVLGAVADYEPGRVRVELRAALLVGAYQLIYLDRIPEFAAVDESVRLTRDAFGRGAGGMVNAILRNLGRAIDARRGPWPQSHVTTADGEQALRRAVRVDWANACHFGFDIFASPQEAGGARYLAEVGGEKFERVSSLISRFGLAIASEVVWASQATPPIVVQRNTLRCSGDEFRNAVREIDQSAEFDHETAPSCAFLSADSGVVSAELTLSGKGYVQDTTARAAARMVGARRSEKIADWCAAPGGKTLALAIDQHDAGEIHAMDDSRDRLKWVEENVERLGLRSVQTRLHGHQATSGRTKKPPDEFDAVLVDVPCSNSGVIARRPEARLDRGPVKLESLHALQRQILADAARTVRGGGRMVYSTCSIDADENEKVVSAFARANAGWVVESSELVLPRWGESRADWRDGGFAVRLTRQK